MLKKFEREKYNIALFCLSFFTIYLIHLKNFYIFFGHNSLADHFIDWEFIKSFAKCAIENKNRFFDNSCDILNRDSVYPPLWLYTPRIIYFIRSEFVFFFGIILLLISIFMFVKVNNLYKFFLIFFIIISPYFLYAYQRLNIDLFIISSIFFIFYNYEKSSFLKKSITHLGIIFLSLLKIYPGILYLFFLKEKKIYQISICLLSMLLVLFFLFFHHNEILVMLGNKEMAGLPGYGSFSGNNFFYFLFNLFGINIDPFSMIFTLINLIVIIFILIIVKEDKVKKQNIHRNKIYFFISGFLILIFCFIIGYNIIYRLIFVLLLVPILSDENFLKIKSNKLFSLTFMCCFFIKCHTITFLLNLFILDYLEIFNLNLKLNTPQEPLPYYDLWDGFLQWVMVIGLLVLFKKNGFHRNLIPKINNF